MLSVNSLFISFVIFPPLNNWSLPVEKINIESFLELAKDHVVIDVRSPAEYNHAHIPGAYSLPLFDDEQRKIVGTAYKQESREAAIKIGLDFFAPKVTRMIEEIELVIRRHSAVDSQQTVPGLKTPNCILIYCWRGGMRSAAVAWLMDIYGFKVYTLVGGYKKFRNLALDSFKFPFRFKILAGFTGSGKTEMLKLLRQSGETVIDLEHIARHRGSVFGSLGSEKQPSQEMFENVLAIQLRGTGRQQTQSSKSNSTEIGEIWLEDESQRIGDVNIPHELWKTMRQSPVYFLDIPFEKRLHHIVSEYGKLGKEKLINCIFRIQRRLGDVEARKAVNLLLEDNTIESFRILLRYYDKWYLKSLHNRENLNSLLVGISCENAGPQNIQALRQQALIS